MEGGSGRRDGGEGGKGVKEGDGTLVLPSILWKPS